MTTREGGCLCGAVRYALRAEPTDASYCHCRLCQRAAGAPVLAFATIGPRAAFVTTRGDAARYRSSSFGERLFCRDSGTQLAIATDDAPDTLDITLASLDDPAAFMPQFHIWTESRIAWFDTDDALPRFPQGQPKP